jgi:hypothetical protein
MQQSQKTDSHCSYHYLWHVVKATSTNAERPSVVRFCVCVLMASVSTMSSIAKLNKVYTPYRKQLEKLLKVPLFDLKHQLHHPCADALAALTAVLANLKRCSYEQLAEAANPLGVLCGGMALDLRRSTDGQLQAKLDTACAMQSLGERNGRPCQSDKGDGVKACQTYCTVLACATRAYTSCVSGRNPLLASQQQSLNKTNEQRALR